MTGTSNVEDFLRTRFEGRGREPLLWGANADLLKRSADIVYESWEVSFEAFRNMGDGSRLDELAWILRDIQLIAVYLMLSGMAVESLLKGIRVGRHPEMVQVGKKVGGKLGGHNLLQQFNNLEIYISEDEVLLINQLTEYIMWAGRYPVPNLPETLEKREAVPIYPSSFVPEHKRNIDEIIDRLYCLLKAEKRKRENI